MLIVCKSAAAVVAPARATIRTRNKNANFIFTCVTNRIKKNNIFFFKKLIPNEISRAHFTPWVPAAHTVLLWEQPNLYK